MVVEILEFLWCHLIQFGDYLGVHVGTRGHPDDALLQGIRLASVFGGTLTGHIEALHHLRGLTLGDPARQFGIQQDLTGTAADLYIHGLARGRYLWLSVIGFTYIRLRHLHHPPVRPSASSLPASYPARYGWMSLYHVSGCWHIRLYPCLQVRPASRNIWGPTGL